MIAEPHRQAVGQINWPVRSQAEMAGGTKGTAGSEKAAVCDSLQAHHIHTQTGSSWEGPVATSLIRDKGARLPRRLALCTLAAEAANGVEVLYAVLRISVIAIFLIDDRRV